MEVAGMGHRVVVGLDGSPSSRAALRWAEAEAQARHAQLVAVTAWQRGHRGLEAADSLEAQARAAQTAALSQLTEASVPIEANLVEGAPAAVVCSEAAGADLLVVGARGRGGFERLLLGSVSTACVRHARGPVIVVRTPDPQLPTLQVPPRRILVGVDGSDGAATALRWSLAEAHLHGATVHALWVWRDPYEGDLAFELQAPRFHVDHARALAAIEERLEALVSAQRHEAAGVPISTEIVGGVPSEVLCARAAHADLLVVGRRGTGSLTDFLIGSVALACAHHAPGPVAVVPLATTQSPGD